MTDLMSRSQIRRDMLILGLHGLIFETSIYYWQDQPGNYRKPSALNSQVTHTHEHAQLKSSLEDIPKSR